MADAAHRGLAGHSSGGYGAMVNAMLRPDLFGGFASHAGDGLFELAYGPEIGPAVKALRDHYGGSLDAFWEDFYARPGRSRTGDGSLLNLGCMAACWSADPDGTVRLPFDVETGELIPEIWDRWLAADPVRMARTHGEALRSLRAIWLDAGRGDEYSLDLATTAFHRELLAAGVAEDRIHFELFDGGHTNAAWRYPLASPGWRSGSGSRSWRGFPPQGTNGQERPVGRCRCGFPSRGLTDRNAESAVCQPYGLDSLWAGIRATFEPLLRR